MLNERQQHAFPASLLTREVYSDRCNILHLSPLVELPMTKWHRYQKWGSCLSPRSRFDWQYSLRLADVEVAIDRGVGMDWFGGLLSTTCTGRVVSAMAKLPGELPLLKNKEPWSLRPT